MADQRLVARKKTERLVLLTALVALEETLML
jgi:hypothetical protein